MPSLAFLENALKTVLFTLLNMAARWAVKRYAEFRFPGCSEEELEIMAVNWMNEHKWKIIGISIPAIAIICVVIIVYS